MQSLAILLLGFAGQDASEPVDLSPAAWPAADYAESYRLNKLMGGLNQLATSDAGVVTGTTSTLAIRSGLEALKQGGTAMDAALTTSLAQVALAAGSWVSYAGILSLVYYDAESGTVHHLNAAYDTVRGEDDPLSIPASSSSGGTGEPSGRTVLVPGFMAGVGAAHERFGVLPFEALFDPAIFFAEKGFLLTSLHDGMIASRAQVLSRLPETRALFTKEDGSFYRAGETFKQPELAATLRKVAAEGPQYMYTGAWGEKLVELVQRDGGKLSAADLAAYEVIWSDPLKVSYGGYDLYLPALPGQGGVHVSEALRIMEAAELAELGPYTESADSFFWLSQIANLMWLSFITPETRSAVLGGADASMKARATSAHAARVWKRMEEGQLLGAQKPRDYDSKHSDAVVVIDGQGNIAALTHTINTATWGETGIFVDGVSIPDSASFQQQFVLAAGPGARLPDPTEPLVILKDGKPYAGLSSIGSGLHQKTLTVLSNLLDFGLGIKPAIDSPSFHMPLFDEGGRSKPQIFEGEFSAELLETLEVMGLDFVVLPGGLSARAPRGYVVGATLDPDTGRREAVSTSMFNGRALGE